MQKIHENIVFGSYDRETGEEFVSIGSDAYMKKNIKETGRQLVWVFGLRQTEEQWYDMLEYETDDIARGLLNKKVNNIDKVFYLN